MLTKYKTISLAIALALGLSACSSGGSSYTEETSPNTNSQPSVSENNKPSTDDNKLSEEAQKRKEVEAKLADEIKKRQEAEAKLAEEAKKQKEEQEAKKLAEAEMKKKEEEEAKKQKEEQDKLANFKASVSPAFADDETSIVYELTNNEKERQNLSDELKKYKKEYKFKENCKVENCGPYVPRGDIIGAINKTYSRYGAIREALNVGEHEPRNAFVYFVDEYVTDPKLVADATYKGKVSYSFHNQPNVTTLKDFQLTVTGDEVSGVANVAEENKSVPAITFKDGKVTTQNGTVGVEGAVEFHKEAFPNETNENFGGTFSGKFSGKQAEEVVGLFGSSTTEDDTSVQGAFIGSK